ncbi:MAG: hypothetical protein IKE60_05765 [Reyranella sp.]|uniref:hypothetical protein n=1 Tax=Reyranella sp. TaxID=1929291 RepID=UPI001AD0EDA0|nr:hypothetical protein [Reyranella sp.]MBN9539973.1 hypothetical protein [Alphaproteobacteria bacterium]MBR2814135.1 hypothetical protein [Reyranella sp.]
MLTPRWMVLVASMAALAGCQSITYQKAGATPAEIEADTKECREYQLRRLVAMGGDRVENMDRDEFEKPCMQARGYRQVMVPSGTTQTR